MYKRKSILLISLGLVTMLLAACSSPLGGSRPGRGQTVRMAQATWDTGWFQPQVFSLLLEELGYTVTEVETLNNVEFYFFSAGGDIDFWANGWFPLHQSYLEFDQVAGKVKPIGFQVEQGALQGYLIDRTTAEELGITNLGDLKDPLVAQVFDGDNDGKADLIGCNTGWGCEGVIDHHLEVYELGETVNHIQGDYSVLMNEAIERYRRGEPVLFYTWTPNWTVSELLVGEDVMWLNVPFSSLPGDPEADTEVGGMTGCLETPCNTGFGVNDIRVVGNTAFLESNPAAAMLFAQVEIPLEDIAAQNALMAAGENGEDDIRLHAQNWIENNRQIVDEWLDEARAAAK
ncbi:MAG: glycine betaine/L-proline ABC transporter substrate-binding protein ProX [Anaerolineales bacterium]|nr:glycine betaine/L-proline ABC transporter substrate-binding protein ProX [Anaerolineales bacterium]